MSIDLGVVSRFNFRADHPFLEIVPSFDGADYCCDILLREFKIDKVLWSDWLGFSLGSFVMLDNPQVQRTDLLSEQLLDHFIGNALCKFIAKIRCAKHRGVLEDLYLFNRVPGAPKVNYKAMDTLFKIFMFGFPFLTGESKVTQTKYVLQLDSQGEWTTAKDVPLPSLKPSVTAWDFEELNKEAEILGVQAKFDLDQINLAMKAKLLVGFARAIYRFDFSEPVDPELLKSPYLRYQLEEQPKDAGEMLRRILEKKTSAKNMATGG